MRRHSVPEPVTTAVGFTPNSEAKLLGLFQVSILHNIVHLLFGIVGIAMARTVTTAKLFLIGGGVIYLILWLYGLLIDQDSSANFVPVKHRRQLAAPRPRCRHDRPRPRPGPGPHRRDHPDRAGHRLTGRRPHEQLGRRGAPPPNDSAVPRSRRSPTTSLPSHSHRSRQQLSCCGNERTTPSRKARTSESVPGGRFELAPVDPHLSRMNS